MKTIFIPGLWFNLNGPIAADIRSKGIGIVDVFGKKLSGRIAAIQTMLSEHPEIETIMAHSAGCLVLSHAINRGLIPPHVKIVFLNSAALPGIKFKVKDPTFKALLNPVYLFKMVFGMKLMLTDKDLTRLMSLTRDELPEAKKSLIADSGSFMRHIVLSQFKKSFKPGFVHQKLGHEEVWVVTSKLDRIMGSTASKTADIYRGVNVITWLGHLASIMNFGDTVKRLEEAGFKA